MSELLNQRLYVATLVPAGFSSTFAVNVNHTRTWNSIDLRIEVIVVPIY